jgi:molybdopterin adenylyltransferase
LGNSLRIGVVTTSDRASRGEYLDEGTPQVAAVLREMIATPFELVAHLIPDEQAAIEQSLLTLSDQGCALIVTTGGTGPSWRDVTVEATLAVGHKHMPGFGEAMRAVSLRHVPTAILSRQEAVIRFRQLDGGQQRGTLIINLPGSIKAIRECLLAVMPAIPYCLELVGHARIATHDAVVTAFIPASAR